MGLYSVHYITLQTGNPCLTNDDVQKYIMVIKYYVKQGLNNVIPCNCIRFWVLCYFKDYGNQGYVKPGPTVISIK